jgi:hypothetical protein
MADERLEQLALLRSSREAADAFAASFRSVPWPPASLPSTAIAAVWVVLAQNCPDGRRMGASRNIRPSSSGSTLIAMVQTANLREGNDVAGRGGLYGTRSRAVLAEREMRSGIMVVLKIAR